MNKILQIKTVLQCLLLALPLTLSCLFALAQPASEFYKRGNDSYKKKRYTEAIDNFGKAIHIDANYGDAYRERGFALIALKRMNEAFADLNKALSLNNNDYRACYGRGLVYESRKEKDALNDYERSSNDPALFVDSYNRIGLIMCSEGQYEGAISYYKRAMKADSLSATPCLIINIIEPLLRVRKFDEALKYINDNSSVQAIQNFSVYTNSLADDDKIGKDASWDFFKSELKPSINNLNKKDYSGAIQSLKESQVRFTIIQETAPDYQKQSYSLLLSLKGYAYEKQGNLKEAIKSYEQSLLIQPTQKEVESSLNTLQAKLALELKNDMTKPVITILEPSNPTRSISVGTDKVASTLQHFRGTVTDDNGLKSVMLNNTPLYTAANGYFDTTVSLQPGFNSFVVVATDNNGNTIVSPITINATNGPAQGSSNDNSNISSATYHAVLIAENDYQDKNIRSLEKPVLDMRLVYNTLINDYTFDPYNIDTLVNASRIDILTALTKKGETLKEGENLLIFYAGHGDLLTNPDNSQESFLLPADAVKGKPFTYINGEEFLKSMRFTKAKHILVVADACFAGSLFRGLGKSGNQSLSEKYKDISRKLLSSGNVKVVPDESEFIPFFLNALRNNKSSLITAEKLVDGFKEQYNIKANQQLQYLPIDYLNDQGGQFVFVRKQ